MVEEKKIKRGIALKEVKGLCREYGFAARLLKSLIDSVR
tara:strand:- start:299 stop:415 length:117 start_codon:yes stop_codon:yes gene_type:complete